MTAVVGRARELERVDALLGSDSGSAAALVLEGEPGIGKTTLWRAGVERAAALGGAVLRAEPAENEQALPFAALADLLDAVSADALGCTRPVARAGDPVTGTTAGGDVNGTIADGSPTVCTGGTGET